MNVLAVAEVRRAPGAGGSTPPADAEYVQGSNLLRRDALSERGISTLARKILARTAAEGELG